MVLLTQLRTHSLKETEMSNAKFIGVVTLVLAVVSVSAFRMAEIQNQTIKYRWADKHGQYCVAVNKNGDKLTCSEAKGDNVRIETIDSATAGEMNLKEFLVRK